MMTIAIIGEESEIFGFLGFVLNKEGYYVRFFQDLRDLFPKLHAFVPDLIILESHGFLPNVEDVCARIRSWLDFHTVRILVLGSESGGDAPAAADAFLPRPLHPRVVIAEVKKLLDRKRTKQPLQEIAVGDLVLEPAFYRVTRSGQTLSLGVREFLLLYFLASNPNVPWSREHLVSVAWADKQVTGRSVDVAIHRLRKQIEENPQKPVRIRSAGKNGYLLHLPVTEPLALTGPPNDGDPRSTGGSERS
jgi:DNA-binding response OmpR family regulator